MGTDIAFPLPGGRWSRRDRMRVGIVGCNGHRTGGWGHPPLRRVTMDFVGAAVPSGPSITAAPPWSPSSVMAAPCHLLPCGAKAIAAPSGALKCRWRSPHPSRLTPCHLPPGEGIVRANLAFPLPGGRWPAGPDEGGSRWVHIPPAGGWGHPPLRRVTIDFVGAAVPSGPSITGAPPWSPSSVMAYGHATFSPAGRRLWPFRRKSSNVDGVPLIRHGLRRATFPQGKALGGRF